MTTLRQPKNWKRQESLVTSREEVGDPQAYEFLEFGRLHPWMFDLWNLLWWQVFQCRYVQVCILKPMEPSESFH